ncbi:MAG: response regulator transcription factor [Campylobacterota bacterium]|nr:response regulator transcription factor [Campylobacterota bacterium]
MKLINKSILLVEDEDGVRNNIAQFLRFTYSDVIEASNGVEALEYYYDTIPDLIITDLHMPQMDGFSLIEAIRQEDPLLPIVVISTHSEKDKLLRSIKLHLVDYIIKPITRSKLKEVLSLAFKDEERSNIVVLDDNYSFDLTHKVLFKNENRIELSRKQNLIIELLVLHKNHTVSGEDIFFHANQENYTLEYSNAPIRNQIQRIRHAVPDLLIKTVYGSGYILTVSNTLNDTKK